MHEAVAHVGLIDVEKLKHDYTEASGTANLADLGVGVAGQNGHLAGGGKTDPLGSTAPLPPGGEVAAAAPPAVRR